MAAPDVIAARQQRAVNQIHAVLKKHGSPEMVELIEARGQGEQWSVRNAQVSGADMFLAALAEDVAALASIVDRLAEAQKPKKRGRPRKDDKAA
jgi:hypothetical protein